MMLKKMIVLFVMITGLLVACTSNDDVTQVDYEGVGQTWRAELEYTEEVLDDDQINAEIDLVISYNDELGESEQVEEISYRLELGDTVYFENSETYEDVEDVSALYVTGETTIDNPLPSGARIILEVTWDNQQEEFQLDRITEE